MPLDSLLLMTGQVRSYNKVIEGAGRLMITLFAQSVTPTNDNETLNRVELCGALLLRQISKLYQLRHLI